MSVACEISPLPDFDALERAAERGLKALQEQAEPGSDLEASEPDP